MLGNLTGAQPAVDPVKDSTSRTFMADVVEGSLKQLVIVDFWAPWCGPCKQLTPILEKLVRAQRGKVTLVKVNIDENQDIAAQLRVQSIPMVYAFFGGRPVDAFNGALPESQVKQWIEQLIKLTAGAGGAAGGEDDPVQAALEEAAARSAAGEHEVALEIYQQIVEALPDNEPAYVGLLKSMIQLGYVEEAEEQLAAAPADFAKSQGLAGIRAELDLRRQLGDAGDTAELRAALERNPADHAARFDLAMALYAAEKRDEAVAELLEIFRREREWNDGAARKQLVKFFEAWGPTDKLTISARRRLSSLMFS